MLIDSAYQSRQNLIPSRILTWNSTTVFNTIGPPSKTLTPLYSLLLAKFTMRIIPFLLAGATLAMFNVYAYAKPITNSKKKGIGHLAPYCDGYNDDTCHAHCASEGFPKSNCTPMYVQLPFI